MKVHILFTGFVSKSSLSGGDQLILDLVPRLSAKLDITIITPNFAAKYWNSLKRKNVKIITLPTNRFDFSSNPISTFISYTIRAFQVFRILRKENEIETIYSCSDVAYADIWPAYLMVGRNKRIKWISRIYHVLLKPGRRQGNYFTNVFAFYLQRLSFWMMKKRSRYVLALNKKLRKEVLNLGFSSNKTGVVGAGVDFDKISSYKAGRRYDYDVVAMGRISPVKGIFDAVKFWKKVHEHNPKYKMGWIGEGNENYTIKFKSMLRKEGLEESFILLGFIDKREVLNILKSAKVFICPDHENGWGLAVCEAMSCGLPVVSYNIDIFGGVYKQGFISAKLFDTDGFARNLIKILEDKDLRNKLGKEAYWQASEFDHDKVVEELMRYLNS